MANTTLQKITAEAKRIRKKQPGLTWISAVKKAGAKYRSGAIGKAPKKRRTVMVKKTVTRRVKVGGIGSTYDPKKRTITTRRGETLAVSDVHLKAAREILAAHLGKLSVKQFLATTKTEKRKIAKEISDVKRRIKRLTK